MDFIGARPILHAACKLPARAIASGIGDTQAPRQTPAVQALRNARSPRGLRMDGSRSSMSPIKLDQDSNATGHGVSQREAFRVWLRVALLSFGGPAGQIAVMHRILVEEKRWISERRFLHALNYCMLLPGPEAQPLATYVGWP